MLVPYKARDLEGHALVGYFLERQYGHEVIYSNGYGIERKLLEFEPDALILDHLSWDFKVRQAELAKKLGMKVIILPTEGLFQNKEGAIRRSGKLHHATRLIDNYLTWGTYPRDAILEEGLIAPDKIHVVGCPRFDFYRSPYLSLMRSKEDLARHFGIGNLNAPMILWATNTPYASRDKRTALFLQTKRAKKPQEEVVKHIEDHITQYHSHSSVITSLAKRHPEWNFIIKVHPAEWINPYVKLIKGLPNIFLAYNMPIREILYYADILIQRNCTTATEAWMLDKPVINLEIGEYRRPVREEYKRGNFLAYSLNEAESIMQNVLRGMSISEEQQKIRRLFIKDFYYKIDGGSSERAAALIHKSISSPEYTEEDLMAKREKVRLAYREWKSREDKRLVNRIKDFLCIPRSTALRFFEKIFFWKAKHNLGYFEAEVEIAPTSVSRLYRQYGDLLNGMENIRS